MKGVDVEGERTEPPAAGKKPGESVHGVVQHLFFDAPDKTRIAYQKVGKGPVLVLANGLGGTFAAWKYVYGRLADRYRILCWDYRGLYGSGPPPDPTNVGVATHCSDLERLLEIEGVERAVFLGWSMGTQVNLEFYRTHADRFAGLVFLNGTSGRPFQTAFGVQLMDRVIPMLLKVMDAAAPAVSAATKRLTQLPALVPLLQTLGLVGKSLDRSIFDELASEFARLDFRLYAKTLAALGQHDATDVLSEVSCPTLVVTGDRDVMTPSATARRICDRIADCRFRLISGASHYAAVEFPAQVSGAIEDFLVEIGYHASSPDWESSSNNEMSSTRE
ncbi:MAG: alpha/beta hydrolase [Deltaproteobacteria bacterium]|nr:alpha/beta hydrolase [Deltaproteobacteria bacterium]